MKPSGDVQVHFMLCPHKVTRQGLTTTVEISHCSGSFTEVLSPFLSKTAVLLSFFFVDRKREEVNHSHSKIDACQSSAPLLHSSSFSRRTIPFPRRHPCHGGRTRQHGYF